MRDRMLLCLLLLVVSACALNQPTPIKQTFLLTASRPEASAPAPAANPGPTGTLKVLPFSVTAPYNAKSMVYREGDVRFEADYYNEWFAAPAAMLTDRTAAWLAKSGVFAKVLPPTSGLEGTLELEGIVVELMGDYRDKAKPLAAVAIQFHCSDVATGKLVYDRLVRETSPLSERTPEALARGVDVALARILTRLENDLRQASLPAK